MLGLTNAHPVSMQAKTCSARRLWAFAYMVSHKTDLCVNGNATVDKAANRDNKGAWPFYHITASRVCWCGWHGYEELRNCNVMKQKYIE